MSDLPALPLPRGAIRLKDALSDEDNVLLQLRYPGQKKEFWDYLMAHNSDIETLVRYHLNINCHVCVMETWNRVVSTRVSRSLSLLLLAVEGMTKYLLYLFASRFRMR